MPDKKKILIICPFAKPNLGGVESHIAKLIDYATSKGYYIILLTYQPLTRNIKGEHFEKHENYEIHRVQWFGVGLFNKLENYFPLVFAYLFPGLFTKSLFYYLKNHKNIHAIHAHGLATCAIVRILTSIYPKNSIVSTHAVYDFKNRPLLQSIIKLLLNGFNTILAVSEVSRKEIIEMGIPEEKVKVHPNWIETDKFIMLDRNKAKEALGITAKHNFLFVSRLIEKKGILQFIQLAEYISYADFHIVGNGPLEEKVKEAQKLNTNIKYYGTLMQENKEEFIKLINLYNACDLFISPYKYDEGFSTTLIESLSCGTPVMVPNRGSPPTFLSEEVTIFLSYDPMIQEVAERALNIINQKKVIKREKCREFAVENFSSKNADIIINSYE